MSAVSEEDRNFLVSFEGRELPEAEWTHLAHIRVAWIYLSLMAPEVALQRIKAGILRYNTEVLRRRHKYHETVTVAFAHIVVGTMVDHESWAEYSGRIDALLSAENPILLRYYSPGRLFSDAAKSNFLPPDLEALPPLTD